jgi:hypothetical protein
MSEQFVDQLTNAIAVLAGPENMLRSRAYSGQPQTSLGERGKLLISGLTMRDLHDCYIRAYIMSHLTREEDGTVIEPNASLYKEAVKGQHAMLNSNALFKLVGDVDPLAVLQNLGCEIEKQMGGFPFLSNRDPSYHTVFTRVRQNVYLSESGREVRLFDIPHPPMKGMSEDPVVHWGLFSNNKLTMHYPSKEDFVTHHQYVFNEE